MVVWKMPEPASARRAVLAEARPDLVNLVEDDTVVGVVRHVDLAAGRIEQPGIAAGRATDRLADDQPAIARPAKADLPGQYGQGSTDETADPLRPAGVIGPCLDREADLLAERGFA